MRGEVQEQLIAARRNQILDAAAKVFGERGFHPTTIKAIAHEAGIADGTIYNYFENKTALLFGVLDRMKQRAVEDFDLTALVDIDFRDFLMTFLRQPLMALKADDFSLFKVVISEIMVNKALRERYYQTILEPTLLLAEPHLQRWAAEGVVKPMDIKLMMRAVSGMILGLMVEYVMGDETLEARWDELPEFLADMIMDGVRREGAR
jgi:AcrR family transcriptional regulator